MGLHFAEFPHWRERATVWKVTIWKAAVWIAKRVCCTRLQERPEERYQWLPMSIPSLSMLLLKILLVSGNSLGENWSYKPTLWSTAFIETQCIVFGISLVPRPLFFYRPWRRLVWYKRNCFPNIVLCEKLFPRNVTVLCLLSEAVSQENLFSIIIIIIMWC